MKLNGRVIKGPNVEYVVIPRSDGDLIFKCQAVLKMDEFENLCKPPTPPDKLLPGGARVPDTNDPVFLAYFKNFGEKRYAYVLVKSLEPTGIEWDTVDIANPETWINWREEFENAGLSWNEIQLIQIGVASANGINQEKLEEARNRFLASLTQLSV